MSLQGTAGPLVVYGQNPAQAGTAYQPDYNGDQAPSAFAQGTLLLDPRYGFRASLQAGALSAVGYYQSGEYLVVDEVPATAAVAAIAAAANVVNGTAMTLVSTSGAGVVVNPAAFTFPVSGVTIPAGAVCLNSAPALITFGQNGAIATPDPRTGICRAVSITGSASATGGAFLVRGLDIHGFAVTESITAASGAATTNGKRGFKVITSVTPQFTDAHTYSVGTADVFEFPLMATQFAQLELFWSNAAITANTGFTAAVGTAATATSGSVRGTYAVQSASDGTKRLQVTISPPAYNVAAANGAASLFGPVQYAA